VFLVYGFGSRGLGQEASLTWSNPIKPPENAPKP
jgi:hypothetical protein